MQLSPLPAVRRETSQTSTPTQDSCRWREDDLGQFSLNSSISKRVLSLRPNVLLLLRPYICHIERCTRLEELESLHFPESSACSGPSVQTASHVALLVLPGCCNRVLSSGLPTADMSTDSIIDFPAGVTVIHPCVVGASYDSRAHALPSRPLPSSLS